MAAEQWDRLQRIFDQAAPLVGAEREALLDRECGDDPALRREVESLLASDGAAGDFIERAIRDAVAAPLPGEGAPHRVGPYEILGELGRGGMGVVYLAERTDRPYRQPAALKLARWSLGHPEDTRRFASERQILATLDHPGIARLLDGGELDDGRPWLAMERVDGAPIDRWCDEHRLTIDERVALFRHVCEVVAFAHRNLVVHRDLKPSNILVTPDGRVKLVDFGIARLLETTAGAGATATGVPRPLTPEYASPEQIRGEPLGTATDVYSLGIVLYELLAGDRPYRFEAGSPSEIERVVCQVEPRRPSEAARTNTARGAADTATPGSARRTTLDRLRRKLSGDLDNIILKAIRKESERRYASVDQLSSDLGLYLAGRPVLARPDTWTYRTGKFLRRNWVGATAVGFMSASLILGLGASLHFAARERSQRALAEARFEDLRSLAATFLEEVDDAIVSRGRIAARERIVSTGLDYLDRLSAQAGSDTSLMRDLARGYLRVAEIQGDWQVANVGRAAAALTAARRGAALAESLYSGAPGDTSVALLAVRGRDLLGVLLQHEGDVAACEARFAAALALRDSLATRGVHALRRPRGDDLLKHWANALEVAGRYAESAGHLESALSRLAELERMHPGREDLETARLVATVSLGQVRMRNGEFASCVALLEPLRDRLQAEASPLRERRLALARIHDNLGRSYDELGREAESGTELTAGLAIYSDFSDSDPDDIGARRMMSTAHHWLGRLRTDQGRHDEALGHMDEMLRIRQELAARDTTSVLFNRDLAVGLDMKGGALRRLGRGAEALDLHRQANAIFRRIADRDTTNADYRRSVAVSWYFIGNLLGDLARSEAGAGQREAARSRWESARDAYVEAKAVMSKLAAAGRLPPGDDGVIAMLDGEIQVSESALEQLARR